MGSSAYRLSDGSSPAVSGLDLARGAKAKDAFADEVLLDFPSVANVVDRMRGAFVDDGTLAPLATDVVLSPRQAFAGATVPLDVPLRCTCRACGGRGECWQDPCPRCLGSGIEVRRHLVLVSVPSRVAEGRCFRLVLAPKSQPSTRIDVRVAIR